MSDRSVPGGGTPGGGTPGGGDAGIGAGSGRSHPDPAADAEGPAEHHRDALSRRELAAKVWAGTGTITVTAAAGVIVGEFSHGLLPGILTFVIAVAAAAIVALFISYSPRLRRLLRFQRHAPEGTTGPARADAGKTVESATPAVRVRAATLTLVCLAALTGISYGVARAFAWGALPGAVSLLAAVAVVGATALLWRLRRSWSSWLRQVLPKLLPRSRKAEANHETSVATGEPDGAKGWIAYPRARVVMACVLATAAVTTGAELGFSVHAAACPMPAELRILASPEDLPAIQAAIPIFEQSEPKYVGSTCFAVQLTAYAPEDAPDPAQLTTDFQSRWDQQALSSIGPEPDIWIPDSTAEVHAVEFTMPRGGPTFGQPRPVGYSPLVIAVPVDLVAADSLESLEQTQSWKTLYADFRGLGIKLALPSPDRSEVGLFETAALYGALNNSADEQRIEASGDFPLDSESLLCQASQTAGQSAGTAYLVSEAAMADYNHSTVDPTEDPCSTPGSVQPMQAFYPAGTAALDFPFTTVNWGGNQGAQRHRYEEDFYNFLTSPAGIAAVDSQGLRPPDCGTGGTINPADGIEEFDPSCENPQTPSATATASALNAFNDALPDASVLIGIDDSGPMKPNLAQITSALDTVLNPHNAPPFVTGDHFGIWDLPGNGEATYASLVKFGAATAARLQQVDKQLADVAAHLHSADYDMLTDAAHVLYAQPRVLPGTGTPPVNSVVLLTDGDGYSGHDPQEGTAFGVRKLFTSAPPFGEGRITLYIIAFGPAGCTPTMLNLADATHGACYPANGGDPRQLLGQTLDQIAGGG